MIVRSAGAAARLRRDMPLTFSESERSKVDVLTPEEIVDYIADLARPAEGAEAVVKGYRVKLRRVQASVEEAKSRRDAVARVVARSLSRGA